MAYGFWEFWIFIVIDIVVFVSFVGYYLWSNFLDTRLRTYIVYPNKQLSLYKRKIVNDTIIIGDKNSNTTKQYAVNKDFIYYRHGRIPYALFFDNIPIPMSLITDIEYNEEEKKLLEKINKKSAIQINLTAPNKKIRDSEDSKKTIEVDTAETFFRILYTNFTLNLLQKPQDFKKAIKWTMILIVVVGGIAVILHLLGVIDLMELLGATPPKQLLIPFMFRGKNANKNNA